MTKQAPMRAIELFAGAGGLGMGISEAGFRPVQIVEWDRWCCDTIRENRKAKAGVIGHWPLPTEGDIRDVDFTRHEGKINLVTGGPPGTVDPEHRAHQGSFVRLAHRRHPCGGRYHLSMRSLFIEAARHDRTRAKSMA